jgi:hypothetical protein
MHDYAVDSDERLKVTLYIAIVSILLMLVVQKSLDFFNMTLPWWIDGISVFSFYAFFLWLFDKHIWKWRLTRIMGLIKTPNIAGDYEGTFFSSYDDFKKPISIRVKIIQTWTKISVNWETELSSSRSFVATIITNDEPNILTYQYKNEPKTNTPSTMHMHMGTATVDILNDVLKGGCYSNRDRKTTGHFEFKKRCLFRE